MASQSTAVMAMATPWHSSSLHIQSFYCFHLVAFVRPELKEALEKNPQEEEDKSTFHQPVQNPQEDQFPGGIVHYRVATISVSVNTC